MTQKDRDELKRLEAAATPGPWYVVDTEATRELFNDCPVIASVQVEDAIIATIGEDVPESEANALLIALTRDELKELLAENQWMRDMLANVSHAFVDMDYDKPIAEVIESFLAETTQ